MTPMLEELSEFEVELPARCRAPLRINLVEPIPDVYAQKSDLDQGAYPEAKAPEEAGRVELARLIPDVAALEERVQIKRLVDPETQLAGSDEEGVAERRPTRLRLVRVGVIAVRRDGELVVTTERFTVLRAANRERLGVEEGTGITKHRTRARRQSDDEHHRLTAEKAAANTSDRRVGPQLGRVPLECCRTAERATVELGVERLQATIRGERQSGSGIMLRGKSKRRTEAALARVGDRSQQALAVVFHLLAAVRNEETRVDRLRYRETELDLATCSDGSA